MKLTDSDKSLLKKWGYLDKDLDQIERAISKTTYKINYIERISAKEALDLLGREVFLSGIARSAFHFSSSRELGNCGAVIAFDSSRLFK